MCWHYNHAIKPFQFLLRVLSFFCALFQRHFINAWYIYFCSVCSNFNYFSNFLVRGERNQQQMEQLNEIDLYWMKRRHHWPTEMSGILNGKCVFLSRFFSILHFALLPFCFDCMCECVFFVMALHSSTTYVLMVK